MEEKWRGKKTEVTTILAVTFCAVTACAPIYMVSSIARRRPSQTEPVSGLVVEANVKIGTLNSTERRQEELDEIVKEGLITFSINATPSLQTGDSEANLLIENPPDDGTRFIVAIIRGDTGEEIYQSGYLDPEQCVDKTPLGAVSPEGEYPYTASFNSHRIRDSSYLRHAAVKITVYALNRRRNLWEKILTDRKNQAMKGYRMDREIWGVEERTAGVPDGSYPGH